MVNDNKTGGFFGGDESGRSLYMKTFDNCPAGLLIFDSNGLIIEANSYILGLIGKEEAAVNSRFCDIFLCSENGKENCIPCPIMEAVSKVQDSKEPVSLRETYHEFIKNGRTDRLWFKLHAEPYTFNGRDYVILTLGDITKQKYLENNLRNLGITDGQTLLYFRKFIIEQLEILATDSSITESPVTIVLMDIDGLNEINEEQGYETGDAVIGSLASIITESIRHTDYAGRYGGEEFLLLLPDTVKEGAAVLTERIMNLFREKRFGTLDKPVTFSAGILEINEPDININHFLDKVRILLLRSKEDIGTIWNAAAMGDFD